jgi:diaminopimelate decarboxylase
MSASADVLARYSIRANELHLGGRSASSLAEEFGTPLYVYDSAAIAQRVDMLRNILPPEISLYYALKANPMPQVVALLGGLVDGMDVASAGELETAQGAGMHASRISFAGPGKRDWELQAAIEAGATLCVESENELQRAAAIGERLGIEPLLALRINPSFRLRASGMHMGGSASPFGIDEEMAPGVLERAAQMAVRLRGLHIYAGSQNLSAASLIEAQDRIFELSERLAGHFPQGMEWLNIGGGFGIPYFKKDRALDLAPIADNLARRLEDAHARIGPCEVVLELGRYLVGEAGVYLCRILDRKVSRGETFLVTDGGMHQHLAASGNFGQVIRKNYPLLLANRVTAEPAETVNVVGPLCTPLDLLGDKVELPHAEPGDLIAVLQSGAYGYSASPLQFLGHPAPGQVLI